MKTAAIICEYNPFHNGHKYLADEARRVCGEDARVIAVMSGNYVQRGEPALACKWARTRAALACGIDAVIELPSVYAASSAQFFAEAAVNIINKLGFVDYLVFGSETGDLTLMQKAAELKISPTDEFKKAFDKALGEGLSYPAAMDKALNMPQLLPNDILGVEYIKALLLSKSTTVPVAVKRAGLSSHTDSSLPEELHSFASANAIRSSLSCPNLSSEENNASYKLSQIKDYMPKEAFAALSSALNEQGGIVTLDKFEQLIFASILKLKPEGLKKLPFVTEGLENKIYRECRNTSSVDELISSCTSSRYTKTRISRIIISIITGASSNHFSGNINIPYVRVLGIKEDAKALLPKISDGARKNGCDFIAGSIPPDFKGLSEASAELLTLEATATDIYFLATSKRRTGAEFREGLIIHSPL